MHSESVSLNDQTLRSLKPAFADVTAPVERGSESLSPSISVVHDDDDRVLARSNVYFSPEEEECGVDMHSKWSTRPNTLAAPQPNHKSHSMPSSFSESVKISTSPAAAFLSFFNPPSAQPAVLPDSEGQVILGHTLGPVVGHGGFSTVRRAISPTGGTVAVKITRWADISKRDDPSLVQKRLKKEAGIWHSLRHEHILPLFSYEHTEYADFFFTLFCPSGSLFDILGRDGRPALPQDEAGTMFRQVVKGLRYLHEEAGMVHGDIKLENVLVDDMGVCRIADFGMTRRIGELYDEDEELAEDTAQVGEFHRSASLAVPPTQPFTNGLNSPRNRNSVPILSSNTNPPTDHTFLPGSLPYASPELLLPPKSGPLLPDPAQDMWALGVLLYALLAGRLPFVDSFEPRLQMKIVQGIYDVPPEIGRRAEQVLKGCLNRSVSTRWTIAMVDAVAWGVGWGVEGDETPDTEDDLAPMPGDCPMLSSSSTSQSVDDIVPQTPERQKDDTKSRLALNVTPQRSSPWTSPLKFSTLKNIIRRGSFSSSSSSSSSSPSSAFHDSGSVAAASTLSSRSRGRRLKQLPLHSPSRSASTSAVPATPVDSVDQFLPPMAVLPSTPERESSRGRRQFSRGLRTSDPTEHVYSTVPGLDALDETARWVASNLETDTPKPVGRLAFPSRIRSGSREDRRIRDASSVGWRGDRRPVVYDGAAGRRAGSMPPAPPSSPWTAGFWSVADTQHSPVYAAGEFFPTSQEMPATKSATRSKSVGPELLENACLVQRLLKYG